MKYFALTGLLIMVAVLALGWRLATRVPQTLLQTQTVEQPRSTGDAAALARQAASARQLATQLNSIATRAFEPRDNGNLIAYSNATPVDLATLLATQGAADKPKPRESRVSLLYSGQGFNRAVVDGRYVRAGDRLPDGARVLNITEDSVLIRSGHRRHVLHVPDSRRVARARN